MLYTRGWKMISKWYIGCIIIVACLFPSFLKDPVAYGTRFAIVEPADTTPPDAPSNIKIVRRSNTSVAISLTPPTKDYHHTKIYRSTSPDEGYEEKFVVEIEVGEQFEYVDTGLREGEEYYYAIAVVDEAGN